MLLEPHPGGHIISITARTTRLHLAQILKLETLSICLPCLVLINAQSEIGYCSTLVSTQIHVHKEHPRRSIFCEQSPSLSGFKSMRMFWMFWTFHHFSRWFSSSSECRCFCLAFTDGTSARAVPWQHPKMGTRTFSLFSCTNLIAWSKHKKRGYIWIHDDT